MINLISNNNKATNAPDHPVYMMCIRVAYAHAYVRARNKLHVIYGRVLSRLWCTISTVQVVNLLFSE